MPNAKDATLPTQWIICLVGEIGSGKTSQILTLPGKVFAFLFDRNALASLRGHDIDYELFLPGPGDAPRKGQRYTGTVGVYDRWINYLNDAANQEALQGYDWLCIDSMTFLEEALLQRTLINDGREKGKEQIQDYKVVGANLTSAIQNFLSLGRNTLMTFHMQSYQDEHTKKVTTEIKLMGSGRIMIPSQATDILLCTTRNAFNKETKKQEVERVFRTQPDRSGLQTLRCTLTQEVEVSAHIRDFTNPQAYGLGHLLTTTQGA